MTKAKDPVTGEEVKLDGSDKPSDAVGQPVEVKSVVEEKKVVEEETKEEPVLTERQQKEKELYDRLEKAQDGRDFHDIPVKDGYWGVRDEVNLELEKLKSKK